MKKSCGVFFEEIEKTAACCIFNSTPIADFVSFAPPFFLKFESHPEWSLLEFLLKMFEEHRRAFHMVVNLARISQRRNRITIHLARKIVQYKSKSPVTFNKNLLRAHNHLKLSLYTKLKDSRNKNKNSKYLYYMAKGLC